MRICLSVTDKFHQKLKSDAEAAGLKISEFVRLCIITHSEEVKKKEAKKKCKN